MTNAAPKLLSKAFLKATRATQDMDALRALLEAGANLWDFNPGGRSAVERLLQLPGGAELMKEAGARQLCGPMPAAFPDVAKMMAKLAKKFKPGETEGVTEAWGSCMAVFLAAGFDPLREDPDGAGILDHLFADENDLYEMWRWEVTDAIVLHTPKILTSSFPTGIDLRAACLERAPVAFIATRGLQWPGLDINMWASPARTQERAGRKQMAQLLSEAGPALLEAGLDLQRLDKDENNLAQALLLENRAVSWTGLPVIGERTEALLFLMRNGVDFEQKNRQGWHAMERLHVQEWDDPQKIAQITDTWRTLQHQGVLEASIGTGQGPRTPRL